MKKAFTLIELLMVISIIAIITTLAVTKVGNLRESSARKVSLANQTAVERGVSAFLAVGGRLNRLDSLVYAGEGGDPIFGSVEGFDFNHHSTPEAADGFYLGPKDDLVARNELNGGLTPGLLGVLCRYTLTQKEATALTSRMGLQYVMAHTAYADLGNASKPADHYPRTRAYGDGTVVEGTDGVTVNFSALVATAVTNRMVVAAVNPKTKAGRAVYRACGQELLDTKDSESEYVEAEVIAEVGRTGGPLLAFGLGDFASIIGASGGGLESAPAAAYPMKMYYSRYILLIRLRPAGRFILPEFAGVIDCCGATIRDARLLIDQL